MRQLVILLNGNTMYINVDVGDEDKFSKDLATMISTPEIANYATIGGMHVVLSAIQGWYFIDSTSTHHHGLQELNRSLIDLIKKTTPPKESWEE